MGDFPVPPTEILPTQMIGMLNSTALITFLSYSKFLMKITTPYKNAMGNKNKRNDRK
jgi:hypothetical protein